jgi:ATP-binding cassette, subfamily F, member 3
MVADITVTEKSFGNKQLYKNIRLSIDDGEKIGFIGRNGVGKSTLLGILTGEDKDFTGDIVYGRGKVVVATHQEHHDTGQVSTIDYILSGLPEYTELQRLIETLPLSMGDDMAQIHRYSEALDRFTNLGYYDIEQLIVEDLRTFQLDETKARGPFTNLSGGQKRLVEVVKVMHSKAHLALIDEPTNHMDYVAKELFIDWMKGAKEAMLIITHDRDVLRHVDRIVEIKDGISTSFDGNYDQYLKQNAHGTTTQMHEYGVTQQRITNLRSKLVQYRRFKEKARDPGTIQRFKRLERITKDELEELEALEKPSFWIDKQSVENLNYKVEENYQKFKAKNIRISGMRSDTTQASRLLVESSELQLGFGSPLFAPVSFQLREGERIELRGRNGAGKTTFIRTLLATVAGTKFDADVYGGTLSVEPKLRIGVYEQEISPTYLDLPLETAVERLYLDTGLSIGRQKIMQLLGDYLFDQGDGAIKVSRLSGGQKARFQLIGMMAGDPQLLILDEPTNHLDLPSIEELEEALRAYAGAGLCVSHDTYFRDAMSGMVVEFKP